ncbi:MAG TPA: DUF1499 domain-containing protein [Gemmataceae bacterium]|nr:DUF1499 domain-containing protein [Gemmataceae bacterium]
MGLLRWFTKNWANTHEPTHRDLTSLVLPVSPAEAVERVKAAVARLSNWKVESAPSPEELHLTRRTGLMGFVDDVKLRFVPAGPGTLIHAASKSRVGIGDLGQNRRNILELWAAIRAHQ